MLLGSVVLALAGAAHAIEEEAVPAWAEVVSLTQAREKLSCFFVKARMKDVLLGIMLTA